MDTFDLLVIYTDGTEHRIRNVNAYRREADKGMFVFEKNGFRHFLPIANVRYFGSYDNYYDY